MPSLWQKKTAQFRPSGNPCEGSRQFCSFHSHRAGVNIWIQRVLVEPSQGSLQMRLPYGSICTT
jgi:hypothetical protein